MKWERRLAVLVVILAFVLVVRGLWFAQEQQQEIAPTISRASPEIIEKGQPFYPIYFPTADAELLAPEFRSGQVTIERVLMDLQEGPRLPFLVSVLPPETKVISYAKHGTILFVNFSDHLVSNHTGGSRAEILTVYGIVNNLVGIDGVEQVQILVENERLHTLVGHLYIEDPLPKDDSILGYQTF